MIYMELEFLDLALIIRATDMILHYDLKDEALFLNLKTEILLLLNDKKNEVIFFGMAPDNTADG